MNAIKESKFEFPNQTAVYNGKVRDVYTINDGHIVIVASDRISAFDYILPKAIPYKGQVLNQLAAKFLKATEDIVQNWLVDTPDPSVAVGHKCEPFKIEMVIRGYMAGHAAREYKAGRRILCGVALPEGLKENDKFSEPIITPATKAEEGHDEDISREEIIAQGIVSEADYILLEKYTRELFQRGTEIAGKRDLILVDTKYEFGKKNGEIYLIDEIHTPDSSRYFYAEGYEARQDANEKQQQLSKEFVREWLIENDFQGLDGQTIPDMTTDFVEMVSNRYIELYEKITGEAFVKADVSDIHARIEANVARFLKSV
ncbi:MAG: phosphoribosylaminoimidazole-succinocarboxamide synthase [Crocinitomix sp.]|jgi:phosphoribosylaminoimidazole-succinocarboxamide synthase